MANNPIYAPRPKRESPIPSTGELEDGVEYMKITFFRHDQRIEIGIYGKGIQPSSQIRKGDLHRYVKELEKEGWYHVYGTGDSEGILAYLERQRITPEKKRESDYIDVKNRHLCDPNIEYCALNLDLDGTPYNGYIVTYHRDQNNTKQLKLTDNGDSVKADLARQGWKIVHQHLVRGGIYQVIYYERPKQAPKTNTPQPQPSGYVRPSDKNNMRDDMEYAYLSFDRTPNNQTFVIEFYDKNSHRKTNRMGGISHADVLAQMKKQGWHQTHSAGNSEGVMNYFQRRISPDNDRNWLPVAPSNVIAQNPIPQPPLGKVKDRRDEFVKRPQRKSGVPINGIHEEGVEYMQIIYFRQSQKAEITLYGKGIQPTTDKRVIGDLYQYRHLLEKDGWCVVYGTGDSEGVFSYLERQPKPQESSSTSGTIIPQTKSSFPEMTPPSIQPKPSPKTIIHPDEWHGIMLGGEQRILQTEANSLFTEIIENGANKRQMRAIKTVLEQSIADGWIHLGTHTGATKTAYILGRNGQVMSSEHITPDQHTQLPNGIRITLIEDLGGELKVCAYDNQKVDNLRNQKKSLDEFVATLTKNGDWQLVYEAEESGNRVIYLGRVMP